MAQRTIVTLTDDLDGSEATETVALGLDGTSYEIDLTAVHAQDLRDTLAPFVSAARRTSGPAARRAAAAPATAAEAGKSRQPSEVDPKAVRAWAGANGVAVNSRGRLSAGVLAQYRAANN